MKADAAAPKHPRKQRWEMTTERTLHRSLIEQLRLHPYIRIFSLLLLTNAVSVVLFLFRLVEADSFRYWFMLWNLLLAWAAPFIALFLVSRLKSISWRTPINLLLTLAWLLFLPNSFYMVSDLIHVRPTDEVSIIFDAVLFSSFIFNGFIAGYIGTFLVHRELNKRIGIRRAYGIVIGIFLLSSYAIYLGRVLRWNTWDALLQPAALLFDVSDTLLRPVEHSQAYVITFSFTLLISAFYLLTYELLHTIRAAKR